MNSHWVYAIGTMIGEERVLAIKFGVTSSSVRTRLRSLQTGSFSRLSILGVRGFDTRRDADRNEKWLHGTFADHRLQGEWFRAVPIIEQMVRRSFTDYFETNWYDEHCWPIHMDAFIENDSFECGCKAPQWRCA